MSEQGDSKQEQSMEEILKSIKRIIADDEIVANASEKKYAEVRLNGVESDVLELTELVETAPAASVMEDVLSAIDTQLEVAAPPPSPTPAKHEDILDNIDSLISNEAAAATSNALHNFKAMQHNAITHTTQQMPQPSLNFRNGTTIEDLVIEALKPELRDWLNTNLPNMVERLVAAEIKKIAGN